MQRHAITERPDWRAKAEQQGFEFHSPDGQAYWDERAFWSFTLAEIETDIEDPTAELEALCRQAVDRVCRDDRLMDVLQIPKFARDFIRASWHSGAPSLYGRFDFSYSGATAGPAKLLEYNADTPTSLYEASAFQWFWLEDQKAARKLPQGADQYNSIHEKLVARFAELSGQGTLHLASVGDHIEDRGTVEYIAECARQGGFPTSFIAIDKLGTGSDGQLYDLQNRRIDRLFKLYPWEWLFAEPAAQTLLTARTGFLEPPWKAILSNKGILALLWEMAPNHPNLLECYFEGHSNAAHLSDGYVTKPLFSREGANITVIAQGRVVDRDEGPYGEEGFIRQALCPLPCVDGNHAVCGSWVIAGKPAGLGIREDRSMITKNTSRFVPHAIIG